MFASDQTPTGSGGRVTFRVELRKSAQPNQDLKDDLGQKPRQPIPKLKLPIQNMYQDEIKLHFDNGEKVFQISPQRVGMKDTGHDTVYVNQFVNRS